MSTATDREAWSARRSEFIDKWERQNPIGNFKPRSGWWKVRLHDVSDWELQNPAPAETDEEKARADMSRESANNLLRAMTGRR
jgi:hypothetical protein